MDAAARSETAEERRARLLGVARELIAREGVSACTFRRLAAAAGTSTRPFTHAFGSRAELLRAVALTTWDDSPLDVHEVGAPVVRPDDWDCIGELRELGEHWLPLTETSSITERVYVEIQLFSLNEPELHAMLVGLSEGANAQLEALLGEGQRRGQVRADLTPRDLVIAFWALLDGLSNRAMYQGDDEMIDRLRRLWIDGIARLLRP
ncbi:MAG: TetR/AcrR family transcriptional regulator [Gaiellales bacterium]